LTHAAAADEGNRRSGDGPAAEPIHITSRSNPLIKQVQRLASDNSAYRRLGRIWIEGDHLCRAALDRQWCPEIAIFCESNWPPALSVFTLSAAKNVVVPDVLFSEMSGLESPGAMGFVMALDTASTAIEPGLATVVLDRLQDAGNVGSVLRSAAAFGFSQVVALTGTAALWGPKVLRAGMGAHFGLRLVEGCDVETLAQTLAVPLLVTSSHEGSLLHEADLPWPCAWVLGHEGQGVGPELMAEAAQHVQIAQPGGEESLNVAAAASVCLHGSAVAAMTRKL
jgi:TrmH family RNA methyltransferase